MNVFNYPDSPCDMNVSKKLELNNRIVVLQGWGPIPHNSVSISYTKTEQLPNYPSLFRYGFRVKALKIDLNNIKN